MKPPSPLRRAKRAHFVVDAAAAAMLWVYCANSYNRKHMHRLAGWLSDWLLRVQRAHFVASFCVSVTTAVLWPIPDPRSRDGTSNNNNNNKVPGASNHRVTMETHARRRDKVPSLYVELEAFM